MGQTKQEHPPASLTRGIELQLFVYQPAQFTNPVPGFNPVPANIAFTQMDNEFSHPGFDSDLRDFCHVVDFHGFAAASRATGRPKSSLSLSVKRLENRLQVRLLDRSTRRRIHLTERGQEFYEEVSGLLSQISEAVDHVKLRSKQITGTLRIAAPYEFGAHHVTPAALRLMALNPRLRVQLDVRYAPPQRLFDDGYDIVFVMASGSLPDSNLVSCRVFSLMRGLFASPAVIEATGPLENLDALARAPCITAPGETHWQFLPTPGQTVDFAIPASRTVSSNAEMRKQAAIAGLGVARITATFCDDAVQNGTLLRVLPDLPCEPLRVYGLIPTKRFVSTKVKAFLKLLEVQR